MAHYIDIALRILEFAIVSGTCWKVFRVMSIFEDFPPHRHINGRVLYPKGYAPEHYEALSATAGK